MINRIIFAAGGTGGHIYPAIAVADELKRINNDIKIKFIGAKGRMEERIIPNSGYELNTIEVSGFKRNLSLKNLGSAFKLLKALNESKKILKSFKPEMVFGTGGYVSGPVLRTAAKLGIMNVVQEGNFYPGVTVKLLSSTANKVIVNFDGTKKYLKRQDNIEVLPYPVRQNMKSVSKKDALGELGLSENRRTLFVFGGSQGANSINTALLKCMKNLLGSDVQIIWQTGNSDFDSISRAVGSNPNVRLFRYIDKIDIAYSACDLVVCRAGISTIMELASMGIAAVFVPFPLAAENHQEKNARALVDKNAAKLILDSELNEKLEATVCMLIHDEHTLEQMRTNIKQFSDNKAASKIVQLLMKMVNNNN
jgi:UDP-N-acetylglucosamine--N-acetylmuramyl-(pentapeptide) pyrophosphoryl-undecaprenol N-acetylglucosamine transferase